MDHWLVVRMENIFIQGFNAEDFKAEWRWKDGKVEMEEALWHALLDLSLSKSEDEFLAEVALLSS